MELYFDRPAMKQRAKANLKRSFWIALVICLLVSIAIGGGIGSSLSSTSINFNFNTDTSVSDDSQSQFPYYTEPYYGENPFGVTPYEEPNTPLVTLLLIAAILIVILALFILIFNLFRGIFAGNPLAVGQSRFFINMTRGNEKFGDVGYGFSKAYGNVVKVMFLRDIYLWLWMLLLLVPLVLIVIGLTMVGVGATAGAGAILIVLGVFGMIPASLPLCIKAYEYSMIPYLLAEHPEMKAKQAFAASKELTYGYKGELFVLELSFIGWQILGSLAFGIGIHFVRPYIYATWAEAYATLCRIHAAKAQMATNPWAPPVTAPLTPAVQETAVKEESSSQEEEPSADCPEEEAENHQPNVGE